jgi:hypothetical protein
MTPCFVISSEAPSIWGRTRNLLIRNNQNNLGELYMKHQIIKDKDRLQIKIIETKGNNESLLETFQLCQQGQCECHTEEYKKIDTMQIDTNEDAITLTLKAKKGQELKQQDIENCVDFAIDKAMKKK